MNLREPLALLGGLSPTAFMRDYWQKRPLLIRNALPTVAESGAPLAPVTPAQLFALAARDDVESRIVIQDAALPKASGKARQAGPSADRWRLKPGPFARRALPPLARRGWTLLVQGVDLHAQAAHELLQRFRWIADARVDDLIIRPGGVLRHREWGLYEVGICGPDGLLVRIGWPSRLMNADLS